MDKYKRFKQRRDELGLCMECKGLRVEGKTLCQKHLDAARERSKTPQARKRVELSRKKLRKETFEAYGGPVCTCCGENEPDFLVIDHINGGGGAHRRQLREEGLNATGGRFYSYLKQQGYPEGYQVLCFNCNHGKELQGGCPHQRIRQP